jgi:hypothetical protein
MTVLRRVATVPLVNALMGAVLVSGPLVLPHPVQQRHSKSPITR